MKCIVLSHKLFFEIKTLYRLHFVHCKCCFVIKCPDDLKYLYLTLIRIILGSHLFCIMSMGRVVYIGILNKQAKLVWIIQIDTVLFTRIWSSDYFSINISTFWWRHFDNLWQRRNCKENDICILGCVTFS